MVLSPNAAARDSFLGWGAFSPEQYEVRPEDDVVRPEQSQDDADSWTIVSEPT